jgi:hypothetical protein
VDLVVISQQPQQVSSRQIPAAQPTSLNEVVGIDLLAPTGELGAWHNALLSLVSIIFPCKACCTDAITPHIRWMHGVSDRKWSTQLPHRDYLNINLNLVCSHKQLPQCSTPKSCWSMRHLFVTQATFWMGWSTHPQSKEKQLPGWACHGNGLDTGRGHDPGLSWWLPSPLCPGILSCRNLILYNRKSRTAEWRSQASILQCCRKTSLWLQDQGLPARIWFTKYPELLPANWC